MADNGINGNRKYAVVVEEVMRRTYIVEGSADVQNINDAIDAVTDAVNADKILLDCEDFDRRRIFASDVFPGGEVPEGHDVSYFSQLADLDDE